jgi:hypothetical protein
MLAANVSLKELYLSGWGPDRPNGANSDAAFFQALAPGLGDNGALSELDVRDNTISSAEKVLLQGACNAKGVTLRV